MYIIPFHLDLLFFREGNVEFIHGDLVGVNGNLKLGRVCVEVFANLEFSSGRLVRGNRDIVFVEGHFVFVGDRLHEYDYAAGGLLFK